MTLADPRTHGPVRPDAVQERLLEVSEVAREERRADKLGALPVDFAGRPRGRKPVELGVDDDTLPLTADTVPEEQVIELGRYLQPKQPLFGTFTKHHHFPPTVEGVTRYITAGNARNKRHPDDTRTREERRVDFIRQNHHIFDITQVGVFDDLNIARVRREALKLTRGLIAAGRELDAQAVVTVSSALEDFGRTLFEQAGLPVAYTEVARQIAVIGIRAADEPELLIKNPLLLKLVQLEQKARMEHWQPRFDATVAHPFGNQLTVDKKEDGIRVDLEIERMRALLPS